MPNDVARRIEAIIGDAALNREAKVGKLRQMETDALARQRASTEGMESRRQDDGENLKLIERALMSLGEKAVDQGPASL